MAKVKLNEVELRHIVREAIDNVLDNNKSSRELLYHIRNLREYGILNDEIADYMYRYMRDIPNISLEEFLWNFVNEVYEDLELKDEKI